MTKTPSELDGLDPLLMPQGSPAVPEAMGAETTEPHRVTDLVATADTEREAALKRGDKETWGVNPAAHPLPLGSFSWYPYPRGRFVDILMREGERFRYASSELIHYNYGKSVACLDTFENGDDRIFVGWLDFRLHYAWKLHLPVPGDVGDVGEVQHHAEIADEQTDGAGLVFLGEGADVGDHVTDGDLVDGVIAKDLEERRGTEPVAGQGAVADVAAGREPFSVHVTEGGTADNGTLHLGLRISRSGEPVPYQVLTDDGLTFGTERTAVLYLRIPAAPAVADVEPAAVPGVPRTNVQGGHQ